MNQELVAKSEKREYGELFRYDLNWGAPDHPPITLTLDDGTTLTATNVSSYRGLRVWEAPALPGTAVEAQLDQLIARTTTNRLVIFHQEDRQAWRWPSRTSRGGGVVSRPARHVHRTGVADPRFGEKLDAIRLPDDVLLDVNAVLTKVRAAFDVETTNETKRASKLMARMYAAVEKAYPAGYNLRARDHEISVSLARVLFLLFGDDTEMWAHDLFQDFIKDHTARDGSDIGPRLNDLFRALDMAPAQRADLPAELAVFPYVNGGIFEERITLPDLDEEFRTAVLDAAAVDWSTISPAIFGSMFQSVRDAQTRRELGEHYTSEENILRTLNPLFLDELRSEFARIMELKAKRRQKLHDLWSQLGEIRYMDPACGCGNFIIVAYRELRELELRIMDALTTIELGEDAQALETDWTHTLKVTLDHFYGIEIDEWPARIAETAMFLIDRQADLRMKERFGVAPERLPIQRAARIEVGNALRVDWATVCPPSKDVIIAGNPPFLGHATRTAEQAQELRDAWGTDDISRLDYVTGWHAKTLRYFGDIKSRWAYVTTNSITQGDPAPHLFAPIFEAGWHIKFAHRTFPWTSEAAGKAAVHCAIVGFTREPGPGRLFDYDPSGALLGETRAKQINAYLVDGPRVFILKRSRPLSPGLPEATFGAMARDGGNLLVEADEVDEVRADPVAAKYLRRFIQARELVNGHERWCLWMVNLEPSDVAKSPVLSTRLAAVREFRAKSKAGSTAQMAKTPHLFGQRPAIRDVPYVGIPRHVSEVRPYFPCGRFPAEVICGDANFMAPDPDGLAFAVLSSSMFLAWQKAVGGRIKSDLRFSNTIVWNNLPLPALDTRIRKQICEAGAAILESRQSGLSLAELYKPGAVAPALAEAHRALDVIVDRAFGARRTCESEEERQAILFQRYQDLAGTPSGPGSLLGSGNSLI